jgi:hypothetical protein
VLFAATSGEARGFFLPGILAAALRGRLCRPGPDRPSSGRRLYGLLYRRRNRRDDPPLRRLFIVATFGWSAVFAVRAGVQAFLYRKDLPQFLAVGKLLLGWPLTIAAVALTLAAVRRTTRSSADVAG